MCKEDDCLRSCQRFREVCPFQLGYFIQQPCPLALNRLQNKEPWCEWYINDPKSNYCFWAHITINNNKRRHTLKQIAGLTDTSINNIKLSEVSGINRLKATLATNDDQINLFDDLKKYCQIYEIIEELFNK